MKDGKELDPFKGIKDFVDRLTPIKILFEVIPICGLILAAFGFVIWNFYLNLFGFSEYNFLQARFLLTGFWAVIFLFFPVIGVLLFAILVKNKIIPFLKWNAVKGLFIFIYIFLLSSCIGLVFGSYVLFIFPEMPPYLGGAKPQKVSLIGAPDQMFFLQNFNIQLAANSAEKQSVQTLPLCLLYENQDMILVGVVDKKNSPINESQMLVYIRDLVLKRDLFSGFQYGLGDTSCKAARFYLLNPVDSSEKTRKILEAEPKISCDDL